MAPALAQASGTLPSLFQWAVLAVQLREADPLRCVISFLSHWTAPMSGLLSDAEKQATTFDAVLCCAVLCCAVLCCAALSSICVNVSHCWLQLKSGAKKTVCVLLIAFASCLRSLQACMVKSITLLHAKHGMHIIFTGYQHHNQPSSCAVAASLVEFCSFHKHQCLKLCRTAALLMVSHMTLFSLSRLVTINVKICALIGSKNIAHIHVALFMRACRHSRKACIAAWLSRARGWYRPWPWP